MQCHFRGVVYLMVSELKLGQFNRCAIVSVLNLISLAGSSRIILHTLSSSIDFISLFRISMIYSQFFLGILFMFKISTFLISISFSSFVTSLFEPDTWPCLIQIPFPVLVLFSLASAKALTVIQIVTRPVTCNI